MLRPGPYVCSEWEMGGLPWWLLKKEDIKLRTNDPYFLERTKLFMNEIGKQLADLQVTRGGNIIMVQVENEYGAYATDKAYIANIRDAVKAAGFTDVPLFQCDWSSTFQLNGLDDLVWTINFGTGANIDAQFKKLKEATRIVWAVRLFLTLPAGLSFRFFSNEPCMMHSHQTTLLSASG